MCYLHFSTQCSFILVYFLDLLPPLIKELYIVYAIFQANYDNKAKNKIGMSAEQSPILPGELWLET